MDRPRFSIRLYPSVVISSVVVLLGTASLNNARGQGFYTHPALPNGHKVVGPPAAASWGRGRLDVVVTGEDGLVYHRYYAANASGPAEGWEAYPALPGNHRAVGPPAVASWGYGRLDFAVTGDDGLVYHRYYCEPHDILLETATFLTNPLAYALKAELNPRGYYGPAEGWEAYPALPGGHRVVGPPAISSWGDGRLDFVVTGDDGLVYHRYYAANAYGPAEGWEAYPALPGGHRVVGPPAVASWGDGRLDFVAIGDDGLVYHRYYAANAYGPAEGWEAYPALPGGHRVVGPRMVKARGPDLLSFYVFGDDGALYHRYWADDYGPAEGWDRQSLQTNLHITDFSIMTSDKFAYAAAKMPTFLDFWTAFEAAQKVCDKLRPDFEIRVERAKQAIREWSCPFGSRCMDVGPADKANAAGERHEKNERGGKKIGVFRLLH